LFDVLFSTLTAVISGAKGWEKTDDFDHLRIEWLKKYGDFSHGVPVNTRSDCPMRARSDCFVRVSNEITQPPYLRGSPPANEFKRF